MRVHQKHKTNKQINHQMELNDSYKFNNKKRELSVVNEFCRDYKVVDKIIFVLEFVCSLNEY